MNELKEIFENYLLKKQLVLPFQPLCLCLYFSLRRGYRADEKKAIVSGKKVSPDIRECCMTNSLSVTTVDRVFG